MSEWSALIRDDVNRRTVYDAGVVPALVLFIRPGEALGSRVAAAATIHNLSVVDDVTLMKRKMKKSNSGNGGNGGGGGGGGGGGARVGVDDDELDTEALVLTRLQDAIAGIVGAHAEDAGGGGAGAPQPWALNAMHPLLRRLLHEAWASTRRTRVVFSRIKAQLR